MKFSDLVGNLDLAIYPIVGLVLFMAVFVGVTVSVMSKRRGRELDRAAMLPLDDGPATIHRGSSPLSSPAPLEVRS